MLEIALLWFLTKLIGKIVEDKGHASGSYKLLTVVLWFSGEVVGLLLGASLARASVATQCSLYMFALLGAATGAGLALLIANNLAPVSSQSRGTSLATTGAYPAPHDALRPQTSASQGSATSMHDLPGQQAKISVYKRYSNGPGNTELVASEAADVDTTSVKVRLTDGGRIGPAYGFQCPWCRKSYAAQDVGRSLILNCVQCGQQMMVATDG